MMIEKWGVFHLKLVDVRHETEWKSARILCLIQVHPSEELAHAHMEELAQERPEETLTVLPLYRWVWGHK